MNSLKKRFGKFAISNEKIAKITGGYECSANGGKNKHRTDDIVEALRWCAARPSCTGCS